MTTTTLALLFALLVQGMIVFALLWLLFTIRVPMVTSREVRLKDIALSRDAWPEREKKVSHAVDNQFQLPVLLAIAVFIALYLGATWLEVALAWIFVISRIVHAVIFVTTNYVVHRFWAYAVGYFVLVAFWIDLLARLFLAALSGI